MDEVTGPRLTHPCQTARRIRRQPALTHGARLTATLVNEMKEKGIGYGLQAICEAGGMANAMILELLGRPA